MLAISSREKIAGAREIGKSSEPLCCILNYNNQLQALLCKLIVCYSAADLERFDVGRALFSRGVLEIVPIPFLSCEGNKENVVALPKQS